MENKNKENDDGSLAFLNIATEQTLKYFNCLEIKQSDLVNLTFTIEDYLSDLKTKHGEGRYLVKITTQEGATRKFFTNSQDIKFVLDKIRELNAFPRRVTLKKNGQRYFFE